MTKVWIVTSGEYSDYEIEAVFSTKGLAEDYIQKMNGAGLGSSYNDIEGWELDLPIPPIGWHVYMSSDGGTSSTWLSKLREGESGFQGFDLYSPPHLLWIVKTLDRERAIKVVNEKRVQILALNIWGDMERVREMVK